MDIEKRFIPVRRNARVYSCGLPASETGQLLVVLHGYGQLAEYFIQHFTSLAEERRMTVVAPEGLSRFYLDENYQRVGASWMTREDRLTDIEEQFEFLQSMLEEYAPNSVRRQLRIYVLGFSQGTATAWRWAARTDVRLNGLALWAGMIPSEPSALQTRHPDLKIASVFGLADPYINEARVLEYGSIIEAQGLKDQVFTFDGGHVMDQAVLSQVMDYFIS